MAMRILQKTVSVASKKGLSTYCRHAGLLGWEAILKGAIIAVTWVNHTTRAVTGIAQPVSKKINWSGSINA